MGNLVRFCGHYWRRVFNGVSLRANRSRDWSKGFGVKFNTPSYVVCVFGDFFVGLKSKLYYKGDDRVSTFVANTFVLAGVIGCFSIFMEILPRIPILYELFYWLFSFVFFGQDPFSLIFLLIEFVAILSIVSGIGYAVCLKNFRE